MTSFERDFNRLFSLAPIRRAENFAPLCELKDSDTHYLLSFDIPGVNKDDIKVELHDSKLYVRGERKSEFKDGGYTEKRYGQFERVISLPEGVKEDQIEASYENGVLNLALPKAEKVQPKQITITDNKKDGIWNRLLRKTEQNNETVA